METKSCNKWSIFSVKERHQWNPTGIFAGASAAQYIQDWSEEESGEEIKFAAATKFFRERNTKVDYKKWVAERLCGTEWLGIKWQMTFKLHKSKVTNLAKNSSYYVSSDWFWTYYYLKQKRSWAKIIALWKHYFNSSGIRIKQRKTSESITLPGKSVLCSHHDCHDVISALSSNKNM